MNDATICQKIEGIVRNQRLAATTFYASLGAYNKYPAACPLPVAPAIQ